MGSKALLYLNFCLLLFLPACGGTEVPKANDVASSSSLGATEPNKLNTVLLGEGAVSVAFPGDWTPNLNKNPYNVQFLSSGGDSNMGIFLYLREDGNKNDGAQELLDFHVEDLKAKRENFTLVEPQTVLDLEDKIITQVVYSGEKDGDKFYYQFGAIAFKDSNDYIPVTLGISLPGDWSRNKTTFNQIHESLQSQVLPK